MADTYTVRELVARLRDVAEQSSMGEGTPVFLDASDRQFAIDSADFDDGSMGAEHPGIYLAAGSELEDLD